MQECRTQTTILQTKETVRYSTITELRSLGTK